MLIIPASVWLASYKHVVSAASRVQRSRAQEAEQLTLMATWRAVLAMVAGHRLPLSPKLDLKGKAADL